MSFPEGFRFAQTFAERETAVYEVLASGAFRPVSGGFQTVLPGSQTYEELARLASFQLGSQQAVASGGPAVAAVSVPQPRAVQIFPEARIPPRFEEPFFPSWDFDWGLDFGGFGVWDWGFGSFGGFGNGMAGVLLFDFG